MTISLSRELLDKIEELESRVHYLEKTCEGILDHETRNMDRFSRIFDWRQNITERLENLEKK